jgi:hypothetical protein
VAFKLQPIRFTLSQKLYLSLQITALLIYDMCFERSKVMLTGGVFTQQANDFFLNAFKPIYLCAV